MGVACADADEFDVVLANDSEHVLIDAHLRQQHAAFLRNLLAPEQPSSEILPGVGQS